MARLFSGRRLNGLRPRKGSAIIELAIMAPVLILITMGVADFGRVFFTSITVNHAAKAGAQYGIYEGYSADSANIALAARNDAGSVSLDSVAVTQSCRCSNGTAIACSSSCSLYGAPQVFVTVRTKKRVPLVFRAPGMPTGIDVSRTVILRAQ